MASLLRPQEEASSKILLMQFIQSNKITQLSLKKVHTVVVNLVLLKCRKLRREDQETSDWIVSRILY